MKRPIIGVLPLWDEHLDSLWMLPGYFEGLEKAGAIPLMLPLSDSADVLLQVVDTVDGLLFTGGQDIPPTLYGEETLPFCGEPCGVRDRMEALLLEAALERDMPVLGICRGIQMINVLLGGTLYQDLPAQLSQPGGPRHKQTPPFDRPIHTVEILEGTPLAALLGANIMPVNSYHHQGVRKLAPRLRPMAKAPDGLVEALYLPEKRFIWGIQWHPEFAPRVPASGKVLRAFVGACRDTAPAGPRQYGPMMQMAVPPRNLS